MSGLNSFANEHRAFVSDIADRSIGRENSQSKVGARIQLMSERGRTAPDSAVDVLVALSECREPNVPWNAFPVRWIRVPDLGSPDGSADPIDAGGVILVVWEPGSKAIAGRPEFVCADDDEVAIIVRCNFSSIRAIVNPDCLAVLLPMSAPGLTLRQQLQLVWRFAEGGLEGRRS